MILVALFIGTQFNMQENATNLRI